MRMTETIALPDGQKVESPYIPHSPEPAEG